MSPLARRQIHPRGVLPVPGELVQQRYRALHELGRGGMGVVLAARDETLRREVALKVVLPHMLSSQPAIERFVNEARSLAQLDCRHVVRVLDFGTIFDPAPSAGLPFMVLELLRGEDLFSVVAREGGLAPARVVRYALEACAGLAAAHARGIVHRDLKPENLFLALEADGSECLKLLDFGIAQSPNRRQSLGEKVGVGSPGYMSPEQVEGTASVDPRSDIWSLGVVMYELLAHRPAFSGDTPGSVCAQILTAPVVPLEQLRPDVPTALIRVIGRCMEREPAKRFSNVAELAEALAPLDDWSPPSEAERIRHQLDSVDDAPAISSVRPRPTLPKSNSDSRLALAKDSRTRRPGGLRYALSLSIALLLFLPAVALLPTVARSPELAPARAWSTRIAEQAKSGWQAARVEASEGWTKLTKRSAAPRQP